MLPLQVLADVADRAIRLAPIAKAAAWERALAGLAPEAMAGFEAIAREHPDELRPYLTMIDIAMHGTKGPVTLAGVSDRQKISLSYLEQLFGKLRRAGLVESVRGPGGGYRAARNNGG